MIRARWGGDAARLAQRLTVRAAVIAAARAEDRVAERRSDGRRWRQARLLWPLFTGRR